MAGVNATILRLARCRRIRRGRSAFSRFLGFAEVQLEGFGELLARGRGSCCKTMTRSCKVPLDGRGKFIQPARLRLLFDTLRHDAHTARNR